jgi:hypothetical protein
LKRVYTTRITRSMLVDPDPYYDDFSGPPINDLNAIAHECMDNPDPVTIDTGLLDANGNSINKTIYRNPIGFFAEIED